MDGMEIKEEIKEVKKSSALAPVLLGLALLLLAAAGVVVFMLGSADMREYKGYLREAKNCINASDYEGAIDNYKEALKMAGGSSEALNGLDRAYSYWARSLEDEEPLLSAEVKEEEADYLSALNEIVDSSNVERMIENAEEEAQAYTDMANGVDPDDTQQNPPVVITGGDPMEVLAVAYELMKNKDYEGMRSVDGSTEADELVQLMKDRGQDVFLYSDDYSGQKDYDGEALGVYIVPEGYYFFYGEYKDGERCGKGTSFWINGTDTYEMFYGEWKDDMPNGEGTQSTIDLTMDSEVRVSGNYTDGLQDGDMLYEYSSSYYSYQSGTYTAKDGDAPAAKVSADMMDLLPEGYIPYVLLDDGNYAYYDPNSEYLGAMGFRYRYTY